MTSIAASLLVLVSAVVLLAPRRWSLLAMIGGMLFLPQGQAIEVLGLHMYPARCLEVVGVTRVILGKELWSVRLNGIDRALVLVYAYTTIVFLLRTALGGGTSASVAQVTTTVKVALLIDALFCYFTFRSLVRNKEDLARFLRDFVWLLGPFVTLVSIERVTGSNPFSVVGGLADVWVDGERVRCNGSFAHPSLLGTFGASVLPLYIALMMDKGHAIRGLVGVVCCLGIVGLANSGGPLIFVVVIIVAWALWSARRAMWRVRWSIAGTLIVLALVMKAPLWYLPDKLSPIVGGGGWHRSYLMHQAIENIDQWWWAGMALDRTADWFPYLIMGAVDLTNTYLVFGLDAGILAIVLFGRLLVRAFRGLGEALASARRSWARDIETEHLLWGLGAAMAGHVANFFTITYWDQMHAIWLMQLAATSGVASAVGVRASVLAREWRLAQSPPDRLAGRDGPRGAEDGRVLRGGRTGMGRGAEDGRVRGGEWRGRARQGRVAERALETYRM